MNARTLIALNLRRLRVAKGLSQENLAIDAAIDRTYVSCLERKLENPTVAVLERLAEALDAKIVDFFQEPQPGDAPVRPLRSGRKPKGR